jgi:hypothetical protein
MMPKATCHSSVDGEIGLVACIPQHHENNREGGDDDIGHQAF